MLAAALLLSVATGAGSVWFALRGRDAMPSLAEPMRTVAPVAEAPTTVPSPSKAVEPVKPELTPEEALALEDENRQLREQLVGLFNWILDNFQGRVALPDSMVGRLDLPAVDEQGILHPELEAFLRISPEQRGEINRAMGTARAAMDRLQQEVLSFEFPDENRLVAVIPPFPEKGAEVREGLYADLHATLGAYRWDKMRASAGGGLERAFDQFGISERRIEMELVAARDGAEETLRMRDEVRIPEEDGSVRITAREFRVADLPAEYRFLLSSLPAPEGDS